MNRFEIVGRVIDSGAVAVIRMADSEKLVRVAEAIFNGGISAIEITMTTPNALLVIEATAKELGPGVQIGVGSVLDAETARMAINSGATYIVSPVLKPEIIHMAHRYGAAAIPGAFTPTEALSAYEAGADIVKIFPADVVGMAFFKAIKAPMPQLQLMPTGGVSLTNAGQWLEAGASVVGVGSALLDKQAIASGNYEKLTENAKILSQSINEFRGK